MELRHLRYFIAVAEELSFTKAAAKLRLAQPSLTRHVRNLEVSNVEIATETPDARPAFWLKDVDGADFFRVRVPRSTTAFDLRSVKDFRVFGSQFVADSSGAEIDSRKI